MIGIVAEFQGAFSFRQITEEFTIPQVQVMLNDRPHTEYGEEVVEIKSAGDFMNKVVSR